MIAILLQNDNFIAIEKPHGISVHNKEDGTNLLEILEKQLAVKKLYPVHRLDKETSGVQLLAFHPEGAKEISHLFQAQHIAKTYVGVLRGQLWQKEGLWLYPLSDQAEGRKNPAGLTKSRQPCNTQFHVLKSSKYLTLCEFLLITGRQHQIRKHAVLNGHEILGDKRYGDLKFLKKLSEKLEIKRMYLHCTKIKFLDYEILSQAPAEFDGFFK